jgi:hypothetical protein
VVISFPKAQNLQTEPAPNNNGSPKLLEMKMIKFRTFAALGTVLLLASGAHAANLGQMNNDPKRPVNEIGAALDISGAQFVACFNDVNPAPAGTKASGEREHANKAILLPCLQIANSEITNAKLDQVMDSFRPEGRVAGNPPPR